MLLACLAIPLALATVALLEFRGRKWIHVFLLPVGICYFMTALLALFFYGDAKM
jgi:hypothetical protein